MKTFYKWIVLAVLIFSAIACYSIGFKQGAFLLVGLGVLLELAFWVGLFKSAQPESNLHSK